MPKPTDPITADDIKAYLATASDFTFELRVLNTLNRLGLVCDHSGTYDDPVTQKTRQFDIQAETTPATPSSVVFRFAIECKNIRENYPLIAHRLPRTASESYLQAILSSRPANTLGPSSYGHRITLAAGGSPYVAGEMVAKSFDQIGKANSGELFAEDRDVFEKLTQALHSSYDLLRRAHFAALHDESLTISIVVPMIVVPPGRLWSVDYEHTGGVVGEPVLRQHISLFVDKDWLVSENLGGATRYTLSHLEIVCLDYLPKLIKHWVDDTRLTHDAIWKTYAEKGPGPRKKPS
jgi:hypothetical protein